MSVIRIVENMPSGGLLYSADNSLLLERMSELVYVPSLSQRATQLHKDEGSLIPWVVGIYRKR